MFHIPANYLSSTGFSLFSVQECNIDIRSFGKDAPIASRYSHFIINGETVETSKQRGFTIGSLLMDKHQCTLQNSSGFDTYGSLNASEDMVQYIRYDTHVQNDGTKLVIFFS